MDLLHEKRELNRGLGNTLSQAFEFAATIGLFFWLGFYLDGRIGIRPVLSIALTLFAVIGNGIKFWYVYDAQMRREEAAYRVREHA